jgi:hypothetical protein
MIKKFLCRPFNLFYVVGYVGIGNISLMSHIKQLIWHIGFHKARTTLILSRIKKMY